MGRCSRALLWVIMHDVSNDDDRTAADAKAELGRLRQEHRDLDVAIDALLLMMAPDQLQVARLKKRKLQLKDRIGQLEDTLIPDIIA